MVKIVVRTKSNTSNATSREPQAPARGGFFAVTIIAQNREIFKSFTDQKEIRCNQRLRLSSYIPIIPLRKRIKKLQQFEGIDIFYEFFEMKTIFHTSSMFHV